MRISEMVKVAIGEDLSLHGAAQMIGADYPDEEIRTIEQRLRRWTGYRQPQSFTDLQRYLKSLGYDIALVKKGQKNVL